ncbi:MAG: hypothetical protein HXS48_24580 [Theionarchaea archaeon]|nr:hypothetical protein [Theionarchaea archaeon]
MKYKAIFIVLLMAMCIGQKGPEEEVEEVEKTLPPDVLPPVPDDAIRDMIRTYFNALNQNDLTTLEGLTHPFYVKDVQPFLEYIGGNNISLELTSISLLMKEEEFRTEMTKNLSDEEFAQLVGIRGVSYELELTMTKQGISFPGCVLFVEVGETEDGWKVLDPSILHLVIESYLEVMESEE